MPSIKDKTTVKAIAREYCSNGRDKAEAMRTIGYADSSCNAGKAVKDVYGNLRVEAAIRRIDEAGAAKSETTVESVQAMYQEAYDLAQTTKQASSMVSAVTGIARLYGMDKDASNDKQEAPPLTDQELEQFKEAAKLATGPKLKRNTA